MRQEKEKDRLLNSGCLADYRIKAGRARSCSPQLSTRAGPNKIHAPRSRTECAFVHMAPRAYLHDVRSLYLAQRIYVTVCSTYMILLHNIPRSHVKRRCGSWFVVVEALDLQNHKSQTSLEFHKEFTRDVLKRGDGKRGDGKRVATPDVFSSQRLAVRAKGR